MKHVTIQTARSLLRDLEVRLVALDAELRTNPTEQAEALRIHLERQHAILHDALATLALGETRPVCVCGKRSHPTREDAEAHRAALVALKLERTDRPRFSLLRKVGPLYTYYCARALGGAYHVGHRIGAR